MEKVTTQDLQRNIHSVTLVTLHNGAKSKWLIMDIVPGVWVEYTVSAYNRREIFTTKSLDEAVAKYNSL